MKNFKKLLAVLLAGLMLLSLVACGGKDDNVEKRGVLHSENSTRFSSSAHNEHKEKNNESLKQETNSYDNLSSALLDLENEKIDSLFVDEYSAAYIVARNDKLTVVNQDRTEHYAMMTMDSNQEVYDILNNAIKDMKADGTLDSLIANELKAYIESDPVAKDLPHFDGAKTIKIGVTGDLPPMDFVAANGQAAGFNIALLTEIANRAKVNFELVQIETGARAMALSTDKVDAVFWSKSLTCNECEKTRTEMPEGTIITEVYFSDATAEIKLKSDK